MEATTAGGGDGAELLTRSVRGVEVVVGGKGFKAGSALVDQMELPKGVVVDHGLRPFPRSDYGEKKLNKIMNRKSEYLRAASRHRKALTVVEAGVELGVLVQECRGSLGLGMSQIEEGTAVVNSGQLC